MKFPISILLLIILLNTSNCSNRHLHKSRKLDCNSRDIERMDSCLIGLQLGEAIQKIDYDPTRMFAVDEPPGMLRGVSVSQGDTCEIRIYVLRTSIFDSTGLFIDLDRKTVTEIIDKKVVGVTWRKYKDKKEVKRNSIGNVIWQWGD